MTTVATLLDEVMVAAPGCEVPFARFQLFRSAVDFFTRSRVWRVSLAPLSYKFARVSDISNAGTPVVTAVGHGFTTGDEVLFADVEGMREINGFLYPITVLSPDTFSLTGVDTTTWPAYSAGTIARVSVPIYPVASPIANTTIIEILSGDSNVTQPEDPIPGFGSAPSSGPGLIPRQPSELDHEFPGWTKYLGMPRWIYCPTETTVRLVPAPFEDRNNAASLRAVLAPSSDACDIPNAEFARHRDTLVSGALARLYAIPKKPWSSAPLTDYHERLYRQGLRRAGIRSRKGNVKAPSTVRAVSYGGL
jgi:hypothetical protein